MKLYSREKVHVRFSGIPPGKRSARLFAGNFASGHKPGCYHCRSRLCRLLRDCEATSFYKTRRTQRTQNLTQMTLFEPAVSFLPTTMKDLVAQITGNEKGADTFCRMYPTPELFEKQTMASMERHFTLIQARRLFAAMRIGWLLKDRNPLTMDRIIHSEGTFKHLQAWCMARQDREFFVIIYLNRNNAVITTEITGVGTRHACPIDPPIVFRRALELQASGLVMAHNHPSNNCVPSQADIEITRKLKNGGLLLGIQVLDSMIITANEYYSMADHGIMP